MSAWCPCTFAETNLSWSRFCKAGSWLVAKSFLSQAVALYSFQTSFQTRRNSFTLSVSYDAPFPMFGNGLGCRSPPMFQATRTASISGKLNVSLNSRSFLKKKSLLFSNFEANTSSECHARQVLPPLPMVCEDDKHSIDVYREEAAWTTDSKQRCDVDPKGTIYDFHPWLKYLLSGAAMF